VTEPLAWLNGEYLPFLSAGLPLSDLGVVGGLAVAEMIRTFGGQPFRLDEHLARLRLSCQRVGFETNLADPTWVEVVQDLVRHNMPLVPVGGDLGIILFVTAGPNPTYVGTGPHGCTHGAHTFSLPFANWASRLTSGVALVTVDAPAIDSPLLNFQVKSRSRMHWHLADRIARESDPGAVALLVDNNGHVSETATSNIVAVRGGRLLTPRRNHVLDGISLRMVADLAKVAGYEFTEADLTVDDLLASDEVLLTSTPTCLLPVRSVNGTPQRQSIPGPALTRLQQLWSEAVGIDIVRQLTAGS
jgi:branched-subunit amino acid aminotransferase/4-amino-4-deoxychorismate lyase